jgi:hypothetical protein
MEGAAFSDTWHIADVHYAVWQMPCCTTLAACTAGVRCFLQRELGNLRAELGHAGGLLEQRAGHFDSATYSEIVPEWEVYG